MAQFGKNIASSRPTNFGYSWLSSGTHVNKPTSEETGFFARRKYSRPTNLYMLN
jgi:hypothetical protein